MMLNYGVSRACETWKRRNKAYLSNSLIRWRTRVSTLNDFETVACFAYFKSFLLSGKTSISLKFRVHATKSGV